MILVTSSLILAAAAQAAAAAPPASSGGRTQADSHTAEISLARYSDCVVRDERRRALALQYLRVAADAPGAAELNSELSSPDCLGQAIPDSITPTASEQSARAGMLGPSSVDVYTLEVQPAAYRNALYPALYRHSFGRTGPGAITDKAALSVSAEWDQVPDPVPDAWRVRRAIGDCMARAHPAAAHRFVVSTPWSDAETSELSEIATALAECLPEGQTARMGREDLRGLIGEALYKLASAPEAPSAATPAEANR